MAEEYPSYCDSDTKDAETSSAPLVSFLVPCYNSASYMASCVDTLLRAGERCEIILVDDGSSDNTAEVIAAYAAEHSNVVPVYQENSNWGGVVNRGIAMARGVYFKIVDSDDRLDPEAVQKVLDTLEHQCAIQEEPDILVTNFVYDHVADNTEHVIKYRSLFPTDQVFPWSAMGKPGIDQVIMVHASWFNLRVLRSTGIILPVGVSYMDSILVLHALAATKRLMYLDINAYYYLIGREGQSVDVEVVKKRIDQQLLASKLAIDGIDYEAIYAQEKNQALLMMGYVVCMMSVSTIYLFKINTPEALQKCKDLWAYMKHQSPLLYKHVHASYAGWTNRRTVLGRKIALLVYAICQRIFKFA